MLLGDKKRSSYHQFSAGLTACSGSGWAGAGTSRLRNKTPSWRRHDQARRGTWLARKEEVCPSHDTPAEEPVSEKVELELEPVSSPKAARVEPAADSHDTVHYAGALYCFVGFLNLWMLFDMSYIKRTVLRRRITYVNI